MAPRIIVRIELTPKARNLIDQCRERAGMTQLSMLSRLVEWFGAQPLVVQSAIMGHYPPEVTVDIAELILKRLGQQAKL